MPRPAPDTTITINTPLPNLADNTGRQHTIGTYILEQLAAGVEPPTAALAAGITPTIYASWIREASIIQQQLQAGTDWNRDYTPLQQDTHAWAAQARIAHGQHVAKLIVVSEQVARGGLVKRETRRKRARDDQGQLQTVEEWVTETTTLPDGEMLRWKIAALAPDVYGRKSAIDITMHDDTDTEAVASLVEERIQAVIEQFTPHALGPGNGDA